MCSSSPHDLLEAVAFADVDMSIARNSAIRNQMENVELCIFNVSSILLLFPHPLTLHSLFQIPNSFVLTALLSVLYHSLSVDFTPHQPSPCIIESTPHLYLGRVHA
jgi:hypothetical protein